jgi:mRNA interferase HigB
MRRVISIKRLREFWLRHPDAEAPLRDWYRTALKANWHHLQDVRRDYPHADGVVVASGRTVTVHNICGNKYRLIVDILYRVQVIYVCAVLTHADYNKDRWKDQL